jgi:hypothetical protein
MKLTVTDSAENFDFWTNRPYLSDITKSLLTDVEALILPEENFRDYPTPLFPSNTISLYDALKNQLRIEAVINDEDYNEVSLNSKKHRFGKFLVVLIAAPLFVTVLGNYISEKLKDEDTSDEIEIEIILQEESGKSKSIRYEGTADNFVKVAEKVKELSL